jgi:diguanylate cyclase (GGDEF)-like protein
MNQPTLRQREQSNAEALLWQGPLRIVAVLVIGAMQGGLQWGGLLDGEPDLTLWFAALYLLIAAGTHVAVQRRRRAEGWLVAVTIAADLLFIFGSTWASSPPTYFDRALFLSLFVLHLTELSFGRVAAGATLAVIVAAYLLIAGDAISAGAPLRWPEELWSLAAFVGAAFAFIFQFGSFRRRLARLAGLFARAEEGDFSQSYDVAADHRPDTITMVGRAYNRMRNQLATMVLTDPLTGCLNRRGFDQELSRATARAARAGGELALLALDMDYFKDVNDTFGHLAGDAVLREAGTMLRGTARLGDVVARTGGEEFMLILPDTDLEGALQLAARVRESFRGRDFDALRGAMRVTVSIGVVADHAPSENMAEDLRARADEALYSAKRAGRDQVVVWQRGAPPVRPDRPSMEAAD